jgi:beta-glucanase (GH16 family)
MMRLGRGSKWSRRVVAVAVSGLVVATTATVASAQQGGGLTAGLDVQVSGSTVTARAALAGRASRAFPEVVVAVRDEAGRNLDFPVQRNVMVSSQAHRWVQSKQFAPGTYTAWVSVLRDGKWRDQRPVRHLVVGTAKAKAKAAGGTSTGAKSKATTSTTSGSPAKGKSGASTTTTARASSSPQSTAPSGPAGAGWKLAFRDDFDGASVDTKKWADSSSAEADGGHGNLGNQQLEWNTGKNCTVEDGHLVMTAKRERTTSSSGQSYAWTSCLLTTTPSFEMRYGYIEERSKLPAERGFWPAFWTWQAASVDRWVETDVYEYYSDNRTKLYLSQHSSNESCTVSPTFDPSGGFHTYAADIEPDGTTFFLDGKQVCKVPGTSSGMTNLITNLAVYEKIQPAASTTAASKVVDWIRVWQR